MAMAEDLASSSGSATPDLLINGSPTTPTSTTLDTPPPSLSRNTARSTSAKFANLRAAFEQDKNTPPPEGLKRRLPSSERVPSRSRDRSQEYEAEIAQLKKDVEHERELRVAYEEKATRLEGDINELKITSDNHVAGLENRLYAMQDETKTQRLENENSTLQQQLAELKRDISVSTRASTELTDSTLEQDFGLLQHEVQNWVVNHFRRAKSNANPEQMCERLRSIGEIKHLDKLVPMYEKFEPSKKLAVYQATVACYLMEMFEDKFLFGMPVDQEWRKRIRRAAETLPAILPSETYSRWRALTFDALRQTEAVRRAAESAADGIAEMICITLKALTDSDEEDEKLLGSLKTIARRALALAHLVRVQPANYDFILPPPGQSFDRGLMDSISVDELDAQTGSVVWCATFPAITKTGDEAGGQLELHNVIFRAKVLCDNPE